MYARHTQPFALGFPANSKLKPSQLFSSKLYDLINSFVNIDFKPVFLRDVGRNESSAKKLTTFEVLSTGFWSRQWNQRLGMKAFTRSRGRGPFFYIPRRRNVHSQDRNGCRGKRLLWLVEQSHDGGNIPQWLSGTVLGLLPWNWNLRAVNPTRDGQITENSVNNMIRLFDRTLKILHKRNPQILQLHLQSLHIYPKSANDVFSGNRITYIVQITFRWLGIVNGRVVPIMPPKEIQPPCNMQ